MLDPRRPGGKYGPAKPTLHPIHSNPPPARSVPPAHRRDRAGYENGVCLCFEHSTGADFETREVDLENKSETFLAASPTGKVPVVVVDGDSLHESNVVNEYLDEVLDGPHLLPEDAKERARARIWMLSADNNFYPAVFVASAVSRRNAFRRRGRS